MIVAIVCKASRIFVRNGYGLADVAFLQQGEGGKEAKCFLEFPSFPAVYDPMIYKVFCFE